MSQLFRPKSCGFVELSDQFNTAPPSPVLNVKENCGDDGEDDSDGCNPISTPFIDPTSKAAAAIDDQTDAVSQGSNQSHNQQMFPILDFFAAALRKSLITCSVEREDVSSMDISWPTEVHHVSHVTFDRFSGFLGLPTELETDVPSKVPSASASVFGVSVNSMQFSFDDRGNSVPTILLMMQRQLYSGGGLKAEGIFRINAENSQEEFVRSQLNRGVVPHGIDVHCLSGLIKAWFRELPAGILDSLTPDKVMNCNTEHECNELVKLLPPTEAALLDWTIDLMADVVQHQEFNKMNARNIAMVFAPNMTKMADPLIALIHAVQVMNFLKTLILKVIKEREEMVSNKTELSSSSYSTIIKQDLDTSEAHTANDPETSKAHTMNDPDKLSITTLDEVQWNIDEKLWCTDIEGNDKRIILSESVSCDITPLRDDGGVGASQNGYRGRDNTEHRLSLRKGVLKLSRHPMFQLVKPTKKTRNLGLVITRGSGGEDWR